jgi:hypothetical protein
MATIFINIKRYLISVQFLFCDDLPLDAHRLVVCSQQAFYLNQDIMKLLKPGFGSVFIWYGSGILGRIPIRLQGLMTKQEDGKIVVWRIIKKVRYGTDLNQLTKNYITFYLKQWRPISRNNQ